MKNSNDSNEINIKFNSRSREIIFNLIPQKIFSSKSSHFYELVSTHVHSFLNWKAKFFFIQSPCHQMTPWLDCIIPPVSSFQKTKMSYNFVNSTTNVIANPCIFNPLTLTSDQDGISPYNIDTISSRQVTRIKKAINYRIVSWSNAKFSELTS